jgi:hypothetical protein
MPFFCINAKLKLLPGCRRQLRNLGNRPTDNDLHYRGGVCPKSPIRAQALLFEQEVKTDKEFFMAKKFNKY